MTEQQATTTSKVCSDCGTEITASRKDASDKVGLQDGDYVVCSLCANRKREYRCQECEHIFPGIMIFNKLPGCPECKSKNVKAEPKPPIESEFAKKVKAGAVGIKNWTTRNWQAPGWTGKAKVLAVAFGILYLFMSADFSLYDVTIEGDTANVKVMLTPLHNLRLAPIGAMEAIHGLAKDYPDLKRIEVSIYMDKDGLTDAYGEEAKEDLYMGKIVETNLEHIRKFKAVENYMAYNYYRALYTSQISSMRHSHLLKD